MIDKTIAWDEYVKMDKMNVSRLVYGCRSMLSLYNVMQDGYDDPTKAMEFGVSLHTLTMQPERFEAEYVVMPDFHLDPENLREPKRKDEPIADRASTSTTTKYCKGKVAQFKKDNPGRKIITRTDYDKILCCIEAMRSKPWVAELLDTNNVEVTVTGEIEGVECKGMIDLLHPNIIVDLKSTDNITMFEKVMSDKNYIFKMAFYWELIRQNSNERDVKIIAQEVKGDFDNYVTPIPKDLLELGLANVMNVLARYKKCLAEGVWPGIDNGEKEYAHELPRWARKKLEDVDWSGVEVGEQVEQESYY